MKNFDEVCRSINWKKMEKARISVRSLSTDKKSLEYLVNFLEELSNSATEVHGIAYTKVHYKSMLQMVANQQKN